MTQGEIRILTVDDHPLLRAGIAGLISDEPDMVLVAEAENGREAIEQFARHRPDVTLMDLQMPEMDGLDALEAIRGKDPEARIVVLTTSKQEQDIVSSYALGANAYVRKPVDFSAFADAVVQMGLYWLVLNEKPPVQA